MSAPLSSRVSALERRVLARSPVWLRVAGTEGEAEAILQQRETDARAEYVAQHGAPNGGFGAIRRIIIVTGVPRAGASMECAQ